MSTKPSDWFDAGPDVYTWKNPKTKLRCDLEALRLIMEKTTWTQAIQSTMLLLFWMAWTVMILQGWIEVSDRYARLMFVAYGATAIILGTIFGRQWGFRIAEVADSMSLFSPWSSNRKSYESYDYHDPGNLEEETTEFEDER